jgi:putative ABC transport system permease protein
MMFVLAGLVIGVATVVAVLGFSEAMVSDINHKLEKYGANILIMPRTNNLTLSYGGMALGGISFEMKDLRQADLQNVQQIKNARNIAAMGPVVLGAVVLSGQQVLLAGVDLDTSQILKPWWQVNGHFPKDEGEIMVGAEAARVLGLRLGEVYRLRDQSFTLVGVLDPTGSQDDQLVFTNLATAQFLLDKAGRVSMVEVAALCTACPIKDMVHQISAALPDAKVMAIQQVVKGRMETIGQFRQFAFGLSVVVMLVGGLVVFVTMMSSVKERTSEIGILRSIGFRKMHVMRIIFMEAGIVSGMAGAIGYLLGLGIIHGGLRYFQAAEIALVPHKPSLVAGAFLIAVAVGLMASIYPAIQAARLDPNDALKAL